MTETPTGYCTITTKSHLARARTLARTLRRHEPAAELYVLLADHIDGAFEPAAEPFRTIELSELDEQDQIQETAFYYRQNEFCWSLKPRLHEHMGHKLGFRRWVYLDVDMAVYHPFAELTRSFDSAAILLSPHLVHANSLFAEQGSSIAKLEAYILHTGPINGGFVGLAACRETEELVKWWKDRLRYYAFDLRPAQFGDQYWLGLVPGFFDSVRVLRHPGANVAYWNLFERRLTRDAAGKILVDGQPLIFFHFAGFDTEQPERLSRYAIPKGLGNYPQIACDLALEYRQLLTANGQAEADKKSYAFSRFETGEPIAPEMRSLYFQEVRAGSCALRRSPFSDPSYFHDRLKKQSVKTAIARTGRRVVRNVRRALNADADLEVNPWKRT